VQRGDRCCVGIHASRRGRYRGVAPRRFRASLILVAQKAVKRETLVGALGQREQVGEARPLGQVHHALRPEPLVEQVGCLPAQLSEDGDGRPLDQRILGIVVHCQERLTRLVPDVVTRLTRVASHHLTLDYSPCPR